MDILIVESYVFICYMRFKFKSHVNPNNKIVKLYGQ